MSTDSGDYYDRGPKHLGMLPTEPDTDEPDLVAHLQRLAAWLSLENYADAGMRSWAANRGATEIVRLREALAKTNPNRSWPIIGRPISLRWECKLCGVRSVGPMPTPVGDHADGCVWAELQKEVEC